MQKKKKFTIEAFILKVMTGLILVIKVQQSVMAGPLRSQIV